MAIVIDVSLRAPGVEQKFKRLDAAMDKLLGKVVQLRQEWQALNATMGQTASSLGSVAKSLKSPSRGGGGSPAGGGSAGRVLAPPTAFSKIANHQHAVQAWSYAKFVRSLGANATPQQLRAHNQAIRGLHKFMSPKQNTLGDIAGVVPGHAGTALSAISGLLTGALSPVAAAATIAAASVATLAAAAAKAKATFVDLSSLNAIGGAGSGQRLSWFEQVAPGALGGARRGLSGIDASIGASIGLSPMTGPLGDMNYAGRASKIMTALRGAKSDRQRQTIVSAFPEYAKVAGYAEHLGTKDWNRFMAGPSGGRQLFDQQGMKGMAKFSMEAELAVGNVMRLFAKFGEGVGKTLTPFLEAFNKYMASEGGKRLEEAFKRAGETASAFLFLLKKLWELIDRLRGVNPDSDKYLKEISMNTRETAQYLRDGTYGGGGRAQAIRMRGWSPEGNRRGDYLEAGLNLI